jgi:hypothetical protein
VGATALGNQKMMRRINRAPQRLELHIASQMGRSVSESTLGGGDLARGQVDDSW